MAVHFDFIAMWSSLKDSMIILHIYIYIFFSSFVFCRFFHLLNWGMARVITSLMYNLIYFSGILHASNDVKNKNTVNFLLTDTLNSDPVFLFSSYLTLYKMGMPSLKDGYLVPFPKVSILKRVDCTR